MNTTEELNEEMDLCGAKVICVKEACLPIDVKRLPRFKDFNVFNYSRQNKKGGGVATLIHKTIVTNKHQTITTTNMEALICELVLSNKLIKKLVNIDVFKQSVTNNELQALLCTPKHLIILEDFNAKHSRWNRGNENKNGPLVYEWTTSYDLILLKQNREATYQSLRTRTLSTLDFTDLL